MAFQPENPLPWRLAGVALFVAGFALTVRMYSALPEDPLVYVLAYVPPAVLLLGGAILAFGGLGKRLDELFRLGV
jgi:hypothetical protein